MIPAVALSLLDADASERAVVCADDAIDGDEAVEVVGCVVVVAAVFDEISWKLDVETANGIGWPILNRLAKYH